MSRPLNPTASAARSSTLRSRWLLGAALLATVLAAFWPGAEPDDAEGLQPLRPAAPLSGAVAQAGGRAASTASGRPDTLANALPDRSAYADATVLHDPFAQPAAPVAASTPTPAAAPVQAVAPPPATLPWQFGGRLQVPDQPDAVLLNDSTRTHTLSVGQTLDGWRLDADRGSRLDFTHLASGQQQSLVLTP